MADFNSGFPQMGNTGFGGGVNYGLPQQPRMSIAVVTGMESVMRYPVAPNNTVFLVDFSAGKFWIKEVYDNGIPKPTREFDFKECIKQDQIPQPGAVTRAEFEQQQHKLDELMKMLEDLTAPSNPTT